jgi:hypothetical protein
MRPDEKVVAVNGHRSSKAILVFGLARSELRSLIPHSIPPLVEQHTPRLRVSATRPLRFSDCSDGRTLRPHRERPRKVVLVARERIAAQLRRLLPVAFVAAESEDRPIPVKARSHQRTVAVQRYPTAEVPAVAEELPGTLVALVTEKIATCSRECDGEQQNENSFVQPVMLH